MYKSKQALEITYSNDLWATKALLSVSHKNNMWLNMDFLLTNTNRIRTDALAQARRTVRGISRSFISQSRLSFYRCKSYDYKLISTLHDAF